LDVLPLGRNIHVSPSERSAEVVPVVHCVSVMIQQSLGL
jgi:hypothetical protein